MDAPKCKLCDKRHYGSCSASVVPDEPRARRIAKRVRTTKYQPGPPAESIDKVDARILTFVDEPAEKKSDAALTSDKVGEKSAPGVSENDSILVTGICPSCRTDLDKVSARLEYQRKLMARRRAKAKDK